MGWTTPVTRSTGFVVTSTDWNAVENNLTYLYQRPQFQVHLSAAQSISNNLSTVCNFDVVDIDTSSGWSASTHKYTVPTGEGGMWLLNADMSWASNSSGSRGVFIITPSGAFDNWMAATTDGNGRAASSGLCLLSALDQVYVQVFQTSGGALNTGSGVQNVQFSGIRVG